MALLRLFLKPGIDKQNTEYGAEGGWVDSDFVRFRDGLPEKLGGWQYFGEGPVNFVGMATDVYTWNAIDSAPYAAIGTNRKVYVFYGGAWADITPIRSTSSCTFDTTNGSTTVVVNCAAHEAIPGDFVTLSNVTGDPGNIPNADLEQEFEVQDVLTDNTFTILSPTAATATDVAAGSADTAFQIHVGSDKSYLDFGWGTGTWGLSTWGTVRPASAALNLTALIWQFDNYGQNLILQQVGGGIYEWNPDSGIGTRATAISGAPTKSNYALVGTPERHLICFGTETVVGDSDTQDPMFVRFSSREDIGNFITTSTNSAGAKRLTDGNKIVSAVRSRGQILIWTDTALHSQAYVGAPYTYEFSQLGANCGCIGPHAAADANGVAYWMGKDAFFVFDGTVKKLPCTVQDYVFQDLNIAQAPAVNLAVNTQFNEVTWFYASLSSDYVNRFVTYNYLENVWSIGSMARTAWKDAGTFDKPLATKYDPTSAAQTITTIYGLTDGRSVLYEQETGSDAIDEPIAAYIRSGYFDIGDGDQVLFMKRFIPDFKRQRGNLTVRLLLRLYPQTDATPSSLDPYTITPTTDKVDTRARGRQVQLRIESNELGSWWRFGTMRVDIQPDGIR